MHIKLKQTFQDFTLSCTLNHQWSGNVSVRFYWTIFDLVVRLMLLAWKSATTKSIF